MSAVPPVDAKLELPPAVQGGGLSVLKYVENGTGRVIELEPFEAKQIVVSPLDYGHLLKMLTSKRPSFPFEIRNVKAKGVPADMEGKPLVVTGNMETATPVAFGLVDGGWLPMPWANKRIALLDRNLVIRLEKLRAFPSPLAPSDPADLSKLLGLDVDTVSPLLFAFEGANRRTPTLSELDEELDRAKQALAELLPGAKLQQIGPVQRAALHRLVLEQLEFRVKATRFLEKSAPLVVNRAKLEKRLALEAEVTKLAAAEGVRRDSLAFLAVVSCIYDSKPPFQHRAATPGRAVLKPRAGYSAEDAYNALADLSFLELMFNVGALFPGTGFVLYTADAGLTAFWSSLHPCERELAHLGGGVSRTTMTFNTTGGLFPDLGEEEAQALSNRISGS
jgi:hypothetical protein